jgi:hypothetical protein
MKQLDPAKEFHRYQSGMQFAVARVLKQADICDVSGITDGLEAAIIDLAAFGCELRQA